MFLKAVCIILVVVAPCTACTSHEQRTTSDDVSDDTAADGGKAAPGSGASGTRAMNNGSSPPTAANAGGRSGRAGRGGSSASGSMGEGGAGARATSPASNDRSKAGSDAPAVSSATQAPQALVDIDSDAGSVDRQSTNEGSAGVSAQPPSAGSGLAGAGAPAADGGGGEGPMQAGTSGMLAMSGASGVSGGAGAAGDMGAAGVSGAAGASAMMVGGTGGALAVAGSGGAGAGAPSAGSSGSFPQGPIAGNSGGAPATPNFPALEVAKLGKPVQIQTTTSFTLAEGPLWDPCAGRLLFTDVDASTIYSMSPTDQVSVFATNTLNANGLAFDRDGSLIMAQMGKPGHVARRDKSGQITTLEPKGSKLHTPDDVIVRADGTIYFSDGDFPPTGGLTFAPLPVYGLTPGAASLQNGGTVGGPNGVELSPDETILYVDATYDGTVVKFAVAPDGTLTKGETMASGLSGPDSLCLDAAGNLYVGVSKGLQVLSPSGDQLGLIQVPASRAVTNCTFGGSDGKTLYITAWTSLWKLTEMPIPGLEWTKNRARLTCQ